MLPVRVPKGYAGQTIRLRINGSDVNLIYLTDLNAGEAIALLTDKGNWYLVGEATQTPNQSSKRIIEYRKTSSPTKKAFKVKILFYIEKTEAVEFYIGGHVPNPKLIYTVNNSEIDKTTISGFIHNYGNSHDYTIQYDTNISNKGVIIQGNVKEDDSLSDGITDQKYYFFNNFAPNYRPKYKGNLIWKSDEILASIADKYFGNFTIDYPNAGVINFEGVYNPGSFTRQTSYDNFNLILNKTDISVNPGNTSQDNLDAALGTDNNIYFANTTKTVNSYLINSVEPLTINSYISVTPPFIKHINCDGKKLLTTWKNAYITQQFSFAYQEYYFFNSEPYPIQPIYPISLTASIQYTLQINGDSVLLNGNNLAGKVTASSPVAIAEGTTSIAIPLNYFTQDEIDVDFINVSEFINIPVIFAKKENSFYWYCKGSISSIDVDGTVSIDPGEPIVSVAVNSCTVNVNLTQVTKVPFVSFASTNGTLLIVNGSTNSLLNAVAGISRFTPSDFHTINDVNMLAADCFYSDYKLGDLVFRMETAPIFFSSTYPAKYDDFNYSTLNALLSKSTYLNKTIYIANVLDEVKSKKSTAYIESWAIDADGNLNFADKVIKEQVYGLRNSNAKILSVSYYP
jgi:hypothetical protein